MMPNKILTIAEADVSILTPKITKQSRPKEKEIGQPRLGPPDEETLTRLNVLAKQYPFCILHRGKDLKVL
jgi:hypothetical protein